MSGGYAILDYNGLDLSDPGTVPGIYEKTKTAIESGKPLILTGVSNDGVIFSGITAYGSLGDDTVYVSFYPVVLQITNEDVVTI